jgi:3-phytase
MSNSWSFVVPTFLVALALAGADVVLSTPAAKVQTEPVPTGGDAADDAAIWIHPVDLAKSLVLGTDKKGGLHAYSLDGHQRQVISSGSRPNNVDLVY